MRSIYRGKTRSDISRVAQSLTLLRANLPNAASLKVLSADCKSAVQQSATLRYAERCGPAGRGSWPMEDAGVLRVLFSVRFIRGNASCSVVISSMPMTGVLSGFSWIRIAGLTGLVALAFILAGCHGLPTQDEKAERRQMQTVGD